MYSSENGHSEVVKLLLGFEGIHFNTIDKSGRTALHYASCFGHTKVVRLLLGKKGIQVDTVDFRGKTALAWAIEKNHPEVAELIERYMTDGASEFASEIVCEQEEEHSDEKVEVE
jgi:ankyrin repeat protein